MTRASKNIGFTVPPGMADEFEEVALEEGSTKSELFRRMFRVYRAYRKELAKAEEVKLTELVARAMQEAMQPMDAAAILAEEDRLQRYGSAQAGRMGVTEADIDRIVYGARKKARA
ncbi:MAG: ribbon-helix-helix protein, CopG family [Methylococcales bacterium]